MPSSLIHIHRPPAFYHSAFYDSDSNATVGPVRAS
jgi:hypothetical protein